MHLPPWLPHCRAHRPHRHDGTSHVGSCHARHRCAEPTLPELITSLLMSASSAKPPHPPRRSVSHLLSTLVAPPDARGASAAQVTRVPLAQTLRELPPLRVLLLVLQVRPPCARSPRPDLPTLSFPLALSPSPCVPVAV
jgi:hypothetical protein